MFCFLFFVLTIVSLIFSVHIIATAIEDTSFSFQVYHVYFNS